MAPLVWRPVSRGRGNTSGTETSQQLRIGWIGHVPQLDAARTTGCTVLVADHQEIALEESRLANEVEFVEDGVELMDYLHRRNGYADLANKPLPAFILLDLSDPVGPSRN